MEKIELKNVSLKGTYTFALTGKVRQSLFHFSALFEVGKVYGLLGELVFSAPAISWCVAGKIRHYEGAILVDGVRATRHQLRMISHQVWVEPNERPYFERRVRTLLKRYLKKSNCNYSFEEMVQTFGLERLDRPLRQCSGERWRASMALGFAQGKSVFCFPWLWYDFVTQYKDIWMKNIFDFLRKNRRIVLVPTGNEQIRDICDEVLFLR